MPRRAGIATFGLRRGDLPGAPESSRFSVAVAALSFAEFESTARRAESQVASGQWRNALDLYCRLLQQRVQDLRFNADALTDTDLLVFERVADLAVPLGETAA